jgi:phage terminase large subunit
MFRVKDTQIETPGGGLIIFEGMQTYTAESIKSLEGYDIAWVEEAQTLSDRSLTLLRPTIRKPNSELWFSWNPRNASDPVDKLLRTKPLPTDAAVVRANYQDNPWFPRCSSRRWNGPGQGSREVRPHLAGKYEQISEAGVQELEG